MESSNYKRCTKCKELKTLGEFHFVAHGARLNPVCQACVRAYARKIYDPVKQKAKLARQVKAGLTREYSKNARERHPEKMSARAAVRRAIRYEGLKKLSCEVCNDPKTEAHHDDYSKPLQVRWLCRRHHAEHHRMT